jgi:hypothetical protein
MEKPFIVVADIGEYQGTDVADNISQFHDEVVWPFRAKC